MPNVEVSEAIYQRLLRRAASFDDRPDDVIARLLDETGDREPATGHAVERPHRAVPGAALPLREYWIPILSVLEDAGGSAPSNDVIEALEMRLQGALTPRDFEPLMSGEVRWRNRARFARLRMKERGLLSDKSHRGLWEITDLGRRFLAEAGGADPA
jgi:hypothetical protein